MAAPDFSNEDKHSRRNFSGIIRVHSVRPNLLHIHWKSLNQLRLQELEMNVVRTRAAFHIEPQRFHFLFLAESFPSRMHNLGPVQPTQSGICHPRTWSMIPD